VFLPGLAQVDVKVDKTGRNDHPRSVENLGVFGRGRVVSEPRGDATVLDQNIFSGVFIFCWVNQVTVGD
jgi:hypothetical protein